MRTLTNQNRFMRIAMLAMVVITLAGCGGQGTTSSATIPADWLTYTDVDTGYSFQYPPTVSLRPVTGEGLDYVYMVMKLDDVAQRIEFYTLENPEQLPIEAFIQTKQAVRFLQPEDKWPVETYTRYASPVSIAGDRAIRIERSPETWPLTQICKYATFIPHGKLVVVASIGPGGRNPTDANWEPTRSGVELYNQVLSTFQFLP